MKCCETQFLFIIEIETKNLHIIKQRSREFSYPYSSANWCVFVVFQLPLIRRWKDLEWKKNYFRLLLYGSLVVHITFEGLDHNLLLFIMHYISLGQQHGFSTVIYVCDRRQKLLVDTKD